MTIQYLAGLIDGEGYLGIIPRQPDKIKGGKNIFYQCVFKLALSGLHAHEVTQQIADKYEGWVYKRNTPTITGKLVYTVEIKSKPRVTKLINDVLPHLIVKKEQAQLMKEFVELPTIHPNYGNYSKQLVERRDNIVKALKSHTERIPLAQTK